MVPSSENYSNIKHEALGLVWKLETLHYFIYGKQCTIQTDHEPLEAIFRKELSSCPAKLQRFVLGALKYDVKVTYVKGTKEFHLNLQQPIASYHSLTSIMSQTHSLHHKQDCNTSGRRLPVTPP